MIQGYPPEFFEGLRKTARRSAERVVPLVLELVSPASVVDVGCGVGSWLAVFRERGVRTILGIDGEYVDRGRLEIPHECFRARDVTRPLDVVERFDLVVTLEVAEHLPPEAADAFVGSVTELGPVVLFSAAVPGQGGFRHLNEQWPPYWVERFEQRGFVPIDALRDELWETTEVEWWYAQNVLFFCRRDQLVGLQRRGPPRGEERAIPPLDLFAVKALPAALADLRQSVVHPKLYTEKCRLLSELSDPRNLSLRASLRALPGQTARALRDGIRRLRGMTP